MLQRKKLGVLVQERKKHKEESNKTMQKVGETPDGQKKHEVDNTSKKNIRDTPEEKTSRGK